MILFDGIYQPLLRKFQSIFTSSTFFKYSHFKFIFLLLHFTSKSLCKTFAVAQFAGKYLNFQLMTLVMFAFSSRNLSRQPIESLTLKIQVKVIDYKIRSYAIRWRISLALKSKGALLLKLLTFARYYYFKLLTLKDLGRGHEVEKFDLRHSIANINLEKKLYTTFFRILTAFSRFFYFISFMISRNCVTLKMQVKVTIYNIPNGDILWQIS